jgi:hypothetical protein
MGFGINEFTCHECKEDFSGDPSIMLGMIMCIHCGAINDVNDIRKEEEGEEDDDTI